tara:strand:- start:790 stop:912 length:123 start_codon:yes stop_codon:yes gene_type:complete
MDILVKFASFVFQLGLGVVLLWIGLIGVLAVLNIIFKEIN